MGAHGLLMKGPPPYEETYRIPLIVRWPGVVAPGSTSDALVSSMDLAPTICRDGGLRAVARRRRGRWSRSCVESRPARRSSRTLPSFTGSASFTRSASCGGRHWKYVFNGFDFDELYDLEADPYEMTNLAPDPAYADVLREMAVADVAAHPRDGRFQHVQLALWDVPLRAGGAKHRRPRLSHAGQRTASP